MIVGTAGHIDHGKTALVKALTGVDVDRLAEEKARGITIELGFAYADLGGGTITGFVDVPGHERFVHTMLAGANGIDFALLVIAADDGIMPQTREHLAILDLLGITRGVVALTKSDLVDAQRIFDVSQDINDLIMGCNIRDAQIIPVSSVTGQGINQLRQALVATEAQTMKRADDGRFRLCVDRSFTLAGAGTVVTGTVLGGRVSVGDHVMLSPTGRAARVRSIHAQNRKSDLGVAGQRCALNLTGEGIGRDVITRGDVVLDPALHAPSSRIDAHLSVLPSEPKPITTWFPARLHLGAAEVGARIVPLEGPIQPGASALVQLVLDQPVAAAVGDRFILRDVSARRTIGGGALVDLRAPPRKRGRPERLAQLRAAAMTDPAAALAGLAETAGLVDLTSFGRDRALSSDQLEAAATALTRIQPVYAILPETLAAIRIQVTEILTEFHELNSDLQGVSREWLRLRLTPRLPKDAFLAFLKSEAESSRIALEGAFLRLPGHVPRLSPEDEKLYDQIAPHLGGEARFRPPRIRDFATQMGEDEAELRRIMRMAARQGRVDQIAKDHFFLRATVEEMADLARNLSAQAPDGWFGAPAFRDHLQNGRKVAIEILDFFDRHGLTLRRGDLRRINPHRADLFQVVRPLD